MELPKNFDIRDPDHMAALMNVITNLIPRPFRYSLTVYDLEEVDGEEFSQIRTVCRADTRQQLIEVLLQSADDIGGQEAQIITIPKVQKVKH